MGASKEIKVCNICDGITDIIKIQCKNSCREYYHIKCHGDPLQEYRQIMTDGKDWYCSECIAPQHSSISKVGLCVYNGQRAIQCDKLWQMPRMGTYSLWEKWVGKNTKWLSISKARSACVCCDANFSFSDLVNHCQYRIIYRCYWNFRPGKYEKEDYQ